MKARDLKRWRKQQFISQTQLAALLDVHPNTVRNWEADRTPVPHMCELALEAISGQRARLVKQLRVRQEELVHQRRLKAISQGKLHV